MEKSLLTEFLELLHVKHTVSYTNRYFQEHPHKYNLFGLSRMLEEYGIPNTGLKLKDKNTLQEIAVPPFIAHLKSEFTIVCKVTDDSVFCIYKHKKVRMDREEFMNMWTGVVLVAEPDAHSIEPDYKAHRRRELFSGAQKLFFGSLIILILLLTYLANRIYNHPGLNILLLLHIAGLVSGTLLLMKQAHISGKYSDKICSLFKQSDCNSILESKAAKLFGTIGWSEIGTGYFIANICILLFLPQLVIYTALINLCALPYSFWSVWYQKVKARQWCPLCLSVQLLLWLIFATDLFFGYIRWPEFQFQALLLIGCIFLLAITGLNLFIPLLHQHRRNQYITQEINSLKATDEVFFALLKKSPFYEVSRQTSRILFGNPQGELLVTVLTNPHCNPCAGMHKRIQEVLKHNRHLCVQYIFSSFNDELKSSNKFLDAVYLENSRKAENIFEEWFHSGKYNPPSFFEKYKPQTAQEETEKEFTAHELWKQQTGLRATPTILINGYLLPENYKIEDLRYITQPLL